MFKIIFFLCCLSVLRGEVVEEEYPMVILGGGIAALSGAVQATHLGIKTLVITGQIPGGNITRSSKIQNWPGEKSISGAKLVGKLQRQAESLGTAFCFGDVIDIDLSKRPFTLTVQNLFSRKVIHKIRAHTCIVSLGKKPKLLKVPGIEENLYKTVFTCSTCDGFRFKNKTVAVIGNGELAAEELAFFSKVAKHVYAIKTEEVLQFQNENKKLILRLSDGKDLPLHGAFLATGFIPNTNLLEGKIALNEQGYIVLQNGQETSIEGLFAAGDATDQDIKLAITASGDAAKAVFQAQKYLCSDMYCLQKIVQNPPIEEVSTLQEIKKLLNQNDFPTAVYFYSEVCPPCKMFSHIFSAWACQFSDRYKFIKISCQSDEKSFDHFQIETTPTVILFDTQGKIVRKVSGFEKLSRLPHFFKSH